MIWSIGFFSGFLVRLGSAPLVCVFIAFLGGGLRLTFCGHLKSPKVILGRAESPNRIHTVV